MADIHTYEAIHVTGNLHTRDINVKIENIIKTPDPPAKNVRFKVEKPIQTFIGRETFLVDLHKLVKEGQNGKGGGVTVLTQELLSVVAATGGIGKTETVRRYIQLHEHEYDHIIWINAEDNSFAQRQFLQLATELKISTDFEGKQKEFESILKEIFGELLLNAHVVLLVFDNAEALEDDEELSLSGIKSLRPTSLSPFFVEPTIIVTSRNQNWRLQKVIHLDLWTEAEVIIFVIGRLELEKNSENESLALQLGALFGRLPIALQSAVAVIHQQIKRKKTYGIQSLIYEYEKGSRKVLTEKPFEENMRPIQRNITMLVLWNISLEKIIKFEDGELAIKILCFMSYMSPVRIPQDFLYALFPNDVSQDSFENAIVILEDYSLIASLSSDDSDSRGLSIHRMIQDSTIENLRTKTNEGQTTHAIFSENTFLNEAEVLLKLSYESLIYLKTFTTLTFPRRMELVETLLQITNHVSGKLDRTEFRDLTAGVAEALQDTNNFTKSIELFERALQATPAPCNNIEIWKKMKLQLMLAFAYDINEHFQKSLDLFLQVLEVKIKFFGPHHKNTLIFKCRVVAALKSLERYDESIEMCKEVLQAFKNNKDTQSKHYLLAKTQYAALLSAKGEKKKASELLTQVLKEQEKDPDSDLDGNLMKKSNLALQLEHEGHLEEASKMRLQIVEDATQLFGPFELATLQSRRVYASALILLGKHNEAASLLLELLKTEETKIGPEHPETLRTKFNLGLVYFLTKELDKAEALLDVEVMDRVLGQEHPETLKAAYFLYRLKEEQEKFEDALALVEKVLQVHKKVLAPNHEDTLSTMFNIGALYVKMKEYEKAARLLQELLETQETQLGSDHRSTLKTKLVLAQVYLKTKDFDKAESLLDVKVWERVFGIEDPETLEAASVLSHLKKIQTKFKETLARCEKVLEVQKKVLLPNYEDTLGTMHAIGTLDVKMDDYEKAYQSAQELLERQEKAIGKDHPDAVQTLEFTWRMERLVARNNLTINFMALTSVDAENAKFFLKASNWDFEAALHTYKNSNPSQTLPDAQIANNFIRIFMTMTGVNEETGKSSLQTSDWNLEDALKAFFDSSSAKDVSDLYQQNDEMFPSAAATDAENQNVDTTSCHKTGANNIQNLGVQTSGVTESSLPTTSDSLRLAGGKRRRGEFVVSSTAKDHYEFVDKQKQQKDPDSNSLCIFTTQLHMASKLRDDGHLDEASKMHLQNIEDATKLFGLFHLVTLHCRNLYAIGLAAQNKCDLAALLLLELLETEVNQLGSDHCYTLDTKISLAKVYLVKKEHAKAEALLDVEIMERVFGPEHPQTLKAAIILSNVKEQLGKFRTALALSEKIFKVRKNVLGPNHKYTLSTMHNIGTLYVKLKEYEKAVEVAQELLELYEKVLGKYHPDAMITSGLLTSCKKLLDHQNNFTMAFIAVTSVDAETAKSFSEAADWNFKAALEAYRSSNPNALIRDQNNTSTRSQTSTAAEIRNNLNAKFTAVTGVSAETGRSLLQASDWNMEVALVSFFDSSSDKDDSDIDLQDDALIPSASPTDTEKQNKLILNFMAVTQVDIEVGKICLQASDWNLEVALEAFFGSSSDEDIEDVDLQDDALILSAAATDAENLNVDSVSCNETEVNQIQDIVVPVKSLAESNQPTKSILFCLAGGTRFRGEFGVSSTVKDLYKFVNGKRPELANFNYVLTLYPNIQLTKMEQTLEEAKIPKNVALTLKMLEQ